MRRLVVIKRIGLMFFAWGSLLINSCTTSDEDVFFDFQTRTLSDSINMSQPDSTQISLILNIGDTIMEYDEEVLYFDL